MAEHKEMVEFRILKYLKDWTNQKVKSGEFATQSEFLITCSANTGGRRTFAMLCRKWCGRKCRWRFKMGALPFSAPKLVKKSI